VLILPDNNASLEEVIRTAANALSTSEVFFGHGTSTAIDEASWLILSAIGLSPALAPDYSQRLTSAQIKACNDLLYQRIEQRVPTAYLTGSAWFAGHQFQSDHRALVPRSPLAEFIVSDFYGVLGHKDKPRILDLCTGSACIAIACAYELFDATVVASDLSADALALAKDNVAMHDMESRVQLLQGNLFEPVTGQFDLIISNPPYVDANDLAAMPAEFHHEPALGLAAGEDGLDLVRQMLSDAPDYLTSDGVLVVEVGNSAQSLVDAYPELPFNWLEFERGGDGVFLLYRDDLKSMASST